MLMGALGAAWAGLFMIAIKSIPGKIAVGDLFEACWNSPVITSSHGCY
jgi:hypothetical protein